ncbi:MAG TPA: CpaF family protein [Alphaproteobacteria bacterium]|nr:CpaF family protein [Alphaproteobacteria bacterium]
MIRLFASKTANAPAPAAPANPPKPASNVVNAAIPRASGLSTLLSPEYTALKVRLHQRLLDMMNLSALEMMPTEEIRTEVAAMVRELLVAEAVPMSAKDQSQLTSDILDEVLGLGPLEPLLKDPTIADIMVNTHARVYIERQGKIELTPVHFKDERHLLRIIDKIVSSVGRRVDESTPMVDARLKDGSRVNAVVSPIAVDGALLSIRKFGTIRPKMTDLIAVGALTEEMADLLRAIVSGRLNVLIAGGTGSGKTTMLNAMSSFISDGERIVTIEDAAELQLQQPHVVRLETRPANIEGRGEITQRDLVKNSLRMRPDRIVVGEVRAGEAFDMLQAMNTGHDGSMTTIHANSCRDAITRLEQMLAMAGFDIPVTSMRQQISSAIHVVVHLERQSDGKRRLGSVHEITGMEGSILTMQEIFKFQRQGVDAQGKVLGQHRATGVRPKFMAYLGERGISVNAELFRPDRVLA